MYTFTAYMVIIPNVPFLFLRVVMCKPQQTIQNNKRWYVYCVRFYKRLQSRNSVYDWTPRHNVT